MHLIKKTRFMWRWLFFLLLLLLVFSSFKMASQDIQTIRLTTGKELKGKYILATWHKAEHLFNTEASPHLSLYWQRVCSWSWSTHWNHQPFYRGSHLCCPFSWWARRRCCCYFCLQVLQRDLAQGGSCWTWSFDQQACRLDGTWQGWTCCIGCSW